jgi:hypothetical protein
MNQSAKTGAVGARTFSFTIETSTVKFLSLPAFSLPSYSSLFLCDLCAPLKGVLK